MSLLISFATMVANAESELLYQLGCWPGAAVADWINGQVIFAALCAA